MNKSLQFLKNESIISALISRLKVIVPLFFLLGGFFPNSANGEGTNELCANDNDETYLYMCNDFFNQCNQNRTQFAVYNCNPDDRLNFSIESTNEVVYFGFKWQKYPNSSDFDIGVFQIKNSTGTIVYAETQIASSGTGYIDNVTQARNGPNQLAGTGGYDAIELAGLSPGEYYIEFDGRRFGFPNETGSFLIKYIDVTIYNTVTATVEDGRLNSKGWQFLEDQPGGQWDSNSSTFFIYSTDSIITSLTYNGMKGRAWLMYCNPYGCANTGNFLLDRKSLQGQNAYVPEYPIFLNMPDPELFPPASTLGQITQPVIGTANCIDGSVDFDVWVDKTGNCEIELVFSNPAYITIKLNQQVFIGQNTLTWNGEDGAGVPVPHDIGITFTVTYINGLTNLPLYDIEDNPNGFVVELVAPAGAIPLVYWDDSNINECGVQSSVCIELNGCLSTTGPGGGCHEWTGGIGGFGDVNTINTWWFAASTSTAYPPIVEQRLPQTLQWNPNPPTTNICPSQTVVFTVDTELNTNTYNWSYSGTGVIITLIGAGNSAAFAFDDNPTSGDITVYGTNSCGDGPVTTHTLNIIASANADAGADDGVCASEATYTILGAAPSNYLTLEWSSSSGGSFVDPTAPNPIYNINATDYTNGTVD